METVLILLVCTFFAQQAALQAKAIKVFNKEKQFTKLIFENKRIRLKTIDGKKIAGRFQVLDDETILVREKYVVKIADIKKMKPHPLGLSISSRAVSAYLSIGLSIAAFMSGAIAEDKGLVWVGLTGFFIVAPTNIVTHPNILRAYKKKRNYQFEIINVTNDKERRKNN